MGNNQKRPRRSQRTCAHAPFASPRLRPALERHKRILQNTHVTHVTRDIVQTSPHAVQGVPTRDM